MTLNVLLVSSKYSPEYSGSGFRAENTYKFLKNRYDLKYFVVANSVIFQDNKYYNDVYRIGRRYDIDGANKFKKPFFILFNLIREFYYSYKFVRERYKEFDLVHTFGGSWSVVFITLYFGFKGKPVIRELCNVVDNPGYPFGFSTVTNFFLKKENSLTVAISKQLNDVCIKYKIKNIWHRINPVNADKFFPVDSCVKYALRTQFTKFSNKDIVLVHCASFMKRKNHIFLLEVLEKLPYRYKLLLAGPAGNVDCDSSLIELKNAIFSKGLGDRVDLQSGFIENIDDYMKLSDVFMFPTYFEGLGTPVLEAQACGIPVVANLMKGVTDITIKYGVGGLYSSLDSDLFAANVVESLSISSDVLRKNAMEIVNNNSTIDNYEYYYSKLKELTK